MLFKVPGKIKPLYWYYEAKYFIQRGMRGWSDRDTWDLGSYLGCVIGESIEHLRKHNHGYPQGMTEKQWDNVLRQISSSFINASRADEIEDEILGDFMNYDVEEQRRRVKKLQHYIKKSQIKTEKAGTQLGKYLLALWD